MNNKEWKIFKLAFRIYLKQTYPYISERQMLTHWKRLYSHLDDIGPVTKDDWVSYAKEK